LAGQADPRALDIPLVCAGAGPDGARWRWGQMAAAAFPGGQLRCPSRGSPAPVSTAAPPWLNW